MSAEVQHDVGDALRHARVRIKREINAEVEDNDYGADVREWAIITILRPEIPEGWGEVYQYHAKTGVVEFRLIIDYAAFKAAPPEKQVCLVFQSILRSIDIFREKPTVRGFDVDRFRSDLLELGTPRGWV